MYFRDTSTKSRISECSAKFGTIGHLNRTVPLRQLRPFFSRRPRAKLHLISFRGHVEGYGRLKRQMNLHPFRWPRYRHSTTVSINYVDFVESRETTKASLTGPARDRRRMNNSTRAVSALERLYSFSSSQPASGSIFAVREIYEASRRKLRHISRTARFLGRKLKCKFYTIAICREECKLSLRFKEHGGAARRIKSAK